jgi:hypothetical protein
VALGLQVEPELPCRGRRSAAAAAFKLPLILLRGPGGYRWAAAPGRARAAALRLTACDPPAAGPGAAGRHQHERDRHGDCQAGTEWRDRPGRYKPDSDSDCRECRVTCSRAGPPRGPP